MASVSFLTNAHRHPKVSVLSAGAFRVWFAAIAYSKEHLTDGHLPRDLEKLRNALGVEVTQGFVDELLAVRENEENLFQKRRKNRANPLWKCRKKWIEIHDWFDWQDSKAEVQQQRRKTRERVKAHREKEFAFARNGVTAVAVTSLHEARNAVTSSPVTPYTPDPGSGIRDPGSGTYVRRVPLPRHDSRTGTKSGDPTSTFRQLSAIVRDCLKTTDYRHDGGEADLAEDVKCAAARQGITWTDPREITKAIQSEEFKAQRRTTR
jgi:hypothetical protein